MLIDNYPSIFRSTYLLLRLAVFLFFGCLITACSNIKQRIEYNVNHYVESVPFEVSKLSQPQNQTERTLENKQITYSNKTYQSSTQINQNQANLYNFFTKENPPQTTPKPPILPNQGNLGSSFELAQQNAITSTSSDNGAKQTIVLLPDPIDTRFSKEFDNLLNILIQTMGSNRYRLVGYYLPWSQPTTTSHNKKVYHYKHRQEPGLVVFENQNASHFFYLVGEAPTWGIQKGAFQVALNTIATAKDKFNELTIIGPTYSGSLFSLLKQTSRWQEQRKRLKATQSSLPSATTKFVVSITSGAATNPENKETVKHYNSDSSDNSEEISFNYTSYATDDQQKLTSLTCFINNNIFLTNRTIALLTEDSSFGRGVNRTEKKPNTEKNKLKEQSKNEKSEENGKCESEQPEEKKINIQTYQFPLHISQIHAEQLSKLGLQKSDNKPIQELIDKKYLKLEFDTFEQTNDTPLPYAPLTTARSNELLVGNIIQDIKSRNIQMVGVIASDIRDQLYLISELKRHAPNVFIFTFESDILLSHPDYIKATKGILIASSHHIPLITGEAIAFASDRAYGFHLAIKKLIEGSKKTNEQTGGSKKPNEQTGDSEQTVISSVSTTRSWLILNDKKTSLKDSPVPMKGKRIPPFWLTLAAILLVSIWLSAPQETKERSNQTPSHHGNTDNFRENCKRSIYYHMYYNTSLLWLSFIVTTPILLILLNNFGDYAAYITLMVIVLVILLSPYNKTSYLLPVNKQVQHYINHAFANQDKQNSWRKIKIYIQKKLIKVYFLIGYLLLTILLIASIWLLFQTIYKDQNLLLRMLSGSSGLSPLMGIVILSTVICLFLWLEIQRLKHITDKYNLASQRITEEYANSNKKHIISKRFLGMLLLIILPILATQLSTEGQKTESLHYLILLKSWEQPSIQITVNILFYLSVVVTLLSLARFSKICGKSLKDYGGFRKLPKEIRYYLVFPLYSSIAILITLWSYPFKPQQTLLYVFTVTTIAISLYATFIILSARKAKLKPNTKNNQSDNTSSTTSANNKDNLLGELTEFSLIPLLIAVSTQVEGVQSLLDNLFYPILKNIF